jgi:ribonuclease HI
MQIVTKKLLDLGVNEDEVINDSQRILLGLENNEVLDWREVSLNKKLSDARAELFVLLKGMDDTKIQQSIITNYKTLQKFRQYGKDFKEIKITDITKEIIQNTSVTIYCDGGCTPNPGRAGSGVAIYRNNQVTELWYGLYEKKGTNNTAELGALYQSLLIAQNESEKGNKVKIKCDSTYSIDCIKTWAISWEKKNWTKKGGKIKNLEIIKKAYYLYNKVKKDVELSHIKAHAGYEGNELADRMAMYAIQELKEDFVKYSKEIDIKEILRMTY